MFDHKDEQNIYKNYGLTTKMNKIFTRIMFDRKDEQNIYKNYV